MAYEGAEPTPIIGGGTGKSSFTAYAVVAGGTTSTAPLQSVASVGTSGQVLTSNGAGALPTFQAASASGAITTITGNTGGAEVPSSGNFNVLGTGSITVAGSANTETVQLTGLTNHNVLLGAGTATITNVAPSSTSGVPLISQGASSDPVFGTAVVAGGGTGDTSFTAYAPICGGTTTTGSLQSADTGLSTSGFVLTSNGSSALPSFQAAASGSSTYFEAYLSTETGDIATGSLTDVVFDATLVNVTSSYNTANGIFTAPATGFYGFSTTLWIGNISNPTTCILKRTGSAETSRIWQLQGAVVDSGTLIINGSWQQKMTSGDTVKLQIYIAGTGNYNIFGNTPAGGTEQISVFTGYRIA